MDHLTARLRVLGRWLLGGFLIFAGLAHLTFARDQFPAQVPDWIPIDVDLVVVASGVVEIGLGLLLVFLWTRLRELGWVVAGLFVAVFPGNLHQYLAGNDAFGLDSDAARLTRLFFQPLLVLWALWCTGALPSGLVRKLRSLLRLRPTPTPRSTGRHRAPR